MLRSSEVYYYSCSDVFKGVKYSTVMDILSAYHQIDIEADSIEQMTLLCILGRYEFLRASLGSKKTTRIFHVNPRNTRSANRLQNPGRFLTPNIALRNSYSLNLRTNAVFSTGSASTSCLMIREQDARHRKVSSPVEHVQARI